MVCSTQTAACHSKLVRITLAAVLHPSFLSGTRRAVFQPEPITTCRQGCLALRIGSSDIHQLCTHSPHENFASQSSPLAQAFHPSRGSLAESHTRHCYGQSSGPEESRLLKYSEGLTRRSSSRLVMRLVSLSQEMFLRDEKAHMHTKGRHHALNVNPFLCGV